MHRPAAVEAAPGPEKEESVPTRRANHWCKGARILEREICAGPSTDAVQTASLLATTGDF